MDDKEQIRGMSYKRPVWQWVVFYVLIALILYGAVYYLFFKKPNTQAQNSLFSNSSTTNPSSPIAPVSPQTTIKEITVIGTEFNFNPPEITVKKGETVEITFKNAGQYPHNLAFSNLNLATKTIQPGQEDVIRFTPQNTGEFTFVCTVPGHADKGMKGTLKVE